MRTMLIVWFMIIGLAWSGEEKKEAVKPEVSTEEPVAKAKADYQKLELAVAEKYGKALVSEEEKATKVGDLDLVTEIQKEKEAISGDETKSTDKEWTKNKILMVAAKNFNDELNKATKSYITALEKVVVELTKQKKIEEAKLVKVLIDELKLNEIKKMFCGTWKFQNGVIQIFYSDGTARCFPSTISTGNWFIQDDYIIVQWSKCQDKYKIPFKRNQILMETDSGKKNIGQKINQE